MIRGLLLDLASRGVSLWVEGSNLRYRAPPGAMTPEVKTLLSEHKLELVDLLGARTAALESWTTAVHDVADAWDTWATRCRDAGIEPPDFDDSDYTDVVSTAIRAGDLQATVEAIGQWRSAWARVFAAPPFPASIEGQVAEVGLEPPATSSSSLARSAPPACFSPEPLPDLQCQEATHRRLLACGEATVAESEGRQQPPNASVDEMYNEARARLGSRDVEEQSITAWLRQHAPEIAAVWLEAPLTAGWFDWRLRVHPEHLSVLERALEEALKGVSKK